MEKVREYKSDRIEICRNCGGTGVVEPEREWRLKRIVKGLSHEIESGQCQVCKGSGRVRKHTEITVTVRSFESDKL